MTATEQLAAYRSRHVIAAVVHGQPPGYPACKVDGIRLVRAGPMNPWRHDPDEIKRLVEAATTESLIGPQKTPLDMAIEHLRELGVHEFKGRLDRGCEECLQPDRGIRHFRSYELLAQLKNIEGGANNGPVWRA